MEPSLVNKRCDIFMNENETLVEERSEHERSERSKASQILNLKMMIQCNYLWRNCISNKELVGNSMEEILQLGHLFFNDESKVDVKVSQIMCFILLML